MFTAGSFFLGRTGCQCLYPQANILYVIYLGYLNYLMRPPNFRRQRAEILLSPRSSCSPTFSFNWEQLSGGEEGNIL